MRGVRGQGVLGSRAAVLAGCSVGRPGWAGGRGRGGDEGVCALRGDAYTKEGGVPAGVRRGRAVLRVARAAVLGRRGGTAVASWGGSGRASGAEGLAAWARGARGVQRCFTSRVAPTRRCPLPPAPVAPLAPLAAVLPSGRKSRCCACACRDGAASACPRRCASSQGLHPPSASRTLVSPVPLAAARGPRPAASALRAAAHLLLFPPPFCDCGCDGGAGRGGCRSESRAGVADPACLRRGGGPRSPPPGVPAKTTLVPVSRGRGVRRDKTTLPREWSRRNNKHPT